MRTDSQINNEIVKLKNLLAIPNRWNRKTLEQIQAQVQVLTERMTPEKVEAQWYCDETEADYRDGDNELWFELDLTSRWMMGIKGYDAPSKGAK